MDLSIFNFLWTWFALGLFLIGLELFLPTFVTLFFGISAIVVGIIFYLAPGTSLETLFYLWGGLSIVTTFLWFKVFKPIQSKRSISDIDLESVKGREGIIIVSNERRDDGVIRFTVPVLDHSEWTFICTDTLKEGDKASIVSFDQNTLVLQKL